MSDGIPAAIVGALVICALISLAVKFGMIHIGWGRKPEAPPPTPAVARTYPRLLCSIAVEAKEAKDELDSKILPRLRLFATVENEGEMVVGSLDGYWKVVTPDKHKHPLVRIQRDVLGPHDKYLESYLLSDGLNTRADGIHFDVEVEFDYMAQEDQQSRHYSAKHRYDAKNHRMIKL
jgi:hypothetical protein